MEQAIEREDPALAEKKVGSGPSSIDHTPSPAEIEHADGRVIVSEEEAYARARSTPEDERPIYVVFAPDDRDNPRNWGKAKKWYITCFVSFLNVMTCLCAGGYSSGVDQVGRIRPRTYDQRRH